MNILISVNAEYLTHAEVMLGSLARRTNEHVDIYLLNHSLKKSETDLFSVRLSKIKNIKLNIVDIPSTVLDNLPVLKHFSIEMYYRIIAQFILPSDLDRILWLDADIIVCKDISSFYNQNFDSSYIIACPDINFERNDVLKIKEKIGLPKEHIYFNSGVLLLNLAELRTSTTIEMILDIARKLMDNLTYPDQDILNYLYQNNVKYADVKKYNYQIMNVKRISHKTFNDIYIMHYIGACKPWKYRHIKSTSKYYWKEAVKSGYIREMILCYMKAIIYKIITTPYRTVKK